MIPPFERPAGYHETELEIKKSRFITVIQPIESVEEAREQLRIIREQHPHANHHCWARLAGTPKNAHMWDCSDDGEPRGTAGKPMLQVLTHCGLGQIQAVVIRYFGGIKLGTGGLVRAYGQAVNHGLETLETESVISKAEVTVSVPHSLTGELEQILRQSKLNVEHREWLENFVITCNLTDEEILHLREHLDRLHDQVQIIVADPSL